MAHNPNSEAALKTSIIQRYLASQPLEMMQWTATELEENLQRVLHQKPRIELEYRETTMIAESGEPITNETVSALTVWFVTENNGTITPHKIRVLL